jgi:hypothetical protein
MSSEIVTLVILAAFWLSLLYYLTKSTRLFTEMRDELSKLNARLDEATRRLTRIDENLYGMNYPK